MILQIASLMLIPLLVFQIVIILRGRSEQITAPVVLISGSMIFVELVLRSFKIGFPALTNTFEALLFFAASILIVVGIYRLKSRGNEIISFGATIVAFILLLISSSPLTSNSLNPPIPALQSNWLLLHVSFAFIGQAFFVVSFVAAISSLLSKKKVEYYRKMVINSIIIGYPIYTAGAIIFGSIWASYAWGSFWSWDPKETWALITWFVYTIILHGRKTKYIKNNTIALLSIIGFMVSLFTFFGVNYLLASLHSYTG
jgi:ABC-type transport system involved in cytochrome c biogenesis permease subunit